MVRVFPLAPLEKIAKKAGAKRVSSSAVKAMKDVILDVAESMASEAVSVAHHAKRVTVKTEDIKIVSRRFSRSR